MPVKQPVIEPHHLEAICRAIGATKGGLSGMEIGHLLRQYKIRDTNPEMSKWMRLYNAFVHFQNREQCSNNILDFLKAAMQPARFLHQDREAYLGLLSQVNKALSFIGVEISDQGTLRKVDAAKTLAEAERRASQFKSKLETWNAHPEIFTYCKPELLEENYFHAIFEGVKSVMDRIRRMTGLYADGHELVDAAFSLKNPLVRINLLKTDTDRSEHTGLCFMIKGLFSMIRNPTAHRPKYTFVIEEEEALDVMIAISLVHKRLDKAL